MEILILLDPETGRVVRAYSEGQEGFPAKWDQTRFPNLAKHIVEIGDETLINKPLSREEVVFEKVWAELGHWQGFDDLIESTDEESKEEIKKSIANALKADKERREQQRRDREKDRTKRSGKSSWGPRTNVNTK